MVCSPRKSPGYGAVDCGGSECEVNDDGVCEVCAFWRELASFKHKADGAKQFPVDDSLVSETTDPFLPPALIQFLLSQPPLSCFRPALTAPRQSSVFFGCSKFH